ncbi:MAG: cupin domain-containing protein [Planctomycetes bacterium]|nr:cupin domain-containing protein [Planctomycetota bacterium]
MVNDVRIGFRVRARRQELGRSLRDLASQTGLSISFLSQVERDLAQPSLASLKQLASALETSVDGLLAEPSNNHQIVLRRADRPAWRLSKVRFELLATRPNRLMEPQLITYEPGGDSGDHPVTHAGEEFVFLLEGRAECFIGAEMVLLDKGDCVYFDAREPHRMRNAGDGPCSLLLVVSPPSF